MSALADACRRVLNARAELTAALLAKEAELCALHRSGVPKTGPNGVAPTARKILGDQGFTESEIGSLSLSESTIRTLIERPRDVIL